MPTYVTPGLYYETVDLDSARINPVRTDIAAFIGIAERGPVQSALAVTTWEQFQSLFGNFIPQGYLAYSVKAFFENGGRRCHIVRVAAKGAATELDGKVAQPADGHSSFVLSTEGFVAGAVVTVRRDEQHQADHLLAQVNLGSNELVWQQALEPWLLGVPLEFFTNAAAAEGVLLDALGAPTLRIEAANEGEWGNRLAIRTAHSSGAATQTTKAVQPPSRLHSYVASVTGFAAGALVKIFQDPNVVSYQTVKSVDSGLKAIAWDAALPAGFDITKPIGFETVEFTLSVLLDGKLREAFERLSLNQASPRWVETVVNGESGQIRVTDLNSVSARPKNLPDPAAANLRNGELRLQAGRDGLAALTPLDFSGEPAEKVGRGLQLLEEVDEVAIVAVPDILIQPAPPVQYLPPVEAKPDPCALCPAALTPADPPPPPLFEAPPVFTLDEIFRVQQAMLTHCERMKYRIAVLDPPLFSGPREARDIAEIQGWRLRFDSKFGALYFPWLLVYDPLQLGGNVVRAVPPSGHAAGIYARVDLETGVHRAPANVEMRWVQDVAAAVNAETQGVLNPLGINVTRAFPGRGIRIHGARTTTFDSDWIFVNVRRLMMMIEKAADHSLQWAVFEPNDYRLRLNVRTALTVFLESVFEAGALAGKTDADSFYVKCDAENNPPELAAAGAFLAQVGVAPALPAEFVVFRVGRTEDRLEVTE
jgi:uncharacterized protein